MASSSKPFKDLPKRMTAEKVKEMFATMSDGHYDFLFSGSDYHISNSESNSVDFKPTSRQ